MKKYTIKLADGTEMHFETAAQRNQIAALIKFTQLFG